MKTSVYAVLNQKGGTAKTTTSVALASRLALLGQRVLLLDMDPQANATMSLGVDANALTESMFDVMVRGESLDRVLVATNIEKLHLGPGHVSLSKTDINLADRDRKQFRLKDLIQEVGHRYDTVVIDCPPSFGLIPVNALVAATGVIVPMVPQYFSLEGLKQVNESIKNIQEDLNPSLELTGILFCMVDTRLRITKPAIDMVRNHYGDKVFKVCIRMSAKVNEAALSGISLFEYAPRSRAATEYGAMVDEVLEKTKQGLMIDRFAFSAFKSIFNPN